MALNYNPADLDETKGGNIEPGDYVFVVANAEEVTFRSGNQGLKIELSVAALPDRDIKVFENFVYLPIALWRLREFMDSIGLDFGNMPGLREIIGAAGKATFVENDRGYLTAKKFHAAPANNAPQRKPQPQRSTVQPDHFNDAPPPLGDDDVPF